jgi:hypothetical protein
MKLFRSIRNRLLMVTIVGLTLFGILQSPLPAVWRGAAALVPASALIVFAAWAERGSAERSVAHAHPMYTAEELGLIYHRESESGPAEDVHRRGVVDGVLPDQGSVRHVITGTWRGMQVTLAQHSRLRTRRRTVHTEVRTVFAVDVELGGSLTIGRSSRFERCMKRIGLSSSLDASVGSVVESFDRGCTVRWPDGTGAAGSSTSSSSLLTVDVQRVLSVTDFHSVHTTPTRMYLVVDGGMSTDTMCEWLEFAHELAGLMRGVDERVVTSTSLQSDRGQF